MDHDRHDYYNIERTSYPSITTDAYEAAHGQYELGEKAIDYSKSYVKEQMSHDIIKKGERFTQMYHSATETPDVITKDHLMESKMNNYDYMSYNLKKNGYGDDFIQERDVLASMSFNGGPVYKKGSVISNRVDPVGTAEITDVKLEMRTEPPEFSFDLNRFSPPKETEGEW